MPVMADMADSSLVLESGSGELKKSEVMEIKKAQYLLELANIEGRLSKDDIQKARITKYYKREGSPGNYKYYYTKEQYEKEQRGEKKKQFSKYKKEDYTTAIKDFLAGGGTYDQFADIAENNPKLLKQMLDTASKKGEEKPEGKGGKKEEEGSLTEKQKQNLAKFSREERAELLVALAEGAKTEKQIKELQEIGNYFKELDSQKQSSGKKEDEDIKESGDKITKSIYEDHLDNVLSKARVTKYYKREGSPGNYKYYYTKDEYDKAKGGKTGEKKKEEDLPKGFKTGDFFTTKNPKTGKVTGYYKIKGVEDGSVTAVGMGNSPTSKISKVKFPKRYLEKESYTKVSEGNIPENIRF